MKSNYDAADWSFYAEDMSSFHCLSQQRSSHRFLWVILNVPVKHMMGNIRTEDQFDPILQLIWKVIWLKGS